jgi:aminoglycoside phosphotransferase
LRGLSIAQVFLATKDQRHWFVRKIGATSAAADRLRVQVAKHQRLRATAGDIVRLPEIYEEGTRGDCYFYDMQYIAGLDAVTFLTGASYEKVQGFTSQLTRYLHHAAAQPAVIEPAHAHFIDALSDKVTNVLSKSDRDDAPALTQILRVLAAIRSRVNVTPTLCHGDLTLENIIIDKTGQAWLIDTLDSPFEHYWQDVSKLHQDLEGGWYLRHQGPISRCIVEHVSSGLMAAVASLDPMYAQVHAVLLAVTFIRILPYVRTPEELALVRQRIAYFAQIATRLTT